MGRDDFFEVDKFPELKFKSSGFWTPVDDPPSAYEATGDLTIRGITKPLSLTVRLEPGSGTATDMGEPQTGEADIIGYVTGEIDRFEFDILSNWPRFTVGQMVKLEFTIVGVKEQEEAVA